MIVRQFQTKMRCNACGDQWFVAFEIQAKEDELSGVEAVPHIVGDHISCPKRPKVVAVH